MNIYLTNLLHISFVEVEDLSSRCGGNVLKGLVARVAVVATVPRHDKHHLGKNLCGFMKTTLPFLQHSCKLF